MGDHTCVGWKDSGLDLSANDLAIKMKIYSWTCLPGLPQCSWLGGSVVERRSLTGELSLVCAGFATDE